MGFSGNKNVDVPDPYGSECMDFNYRALLAPLFDTLLGHKKKLLQANVHARAELSVFGC